MLRITFFPLNVSQEAEQAAGRGCAVHAWRFSRQSGCNLMSDPPLSKRLEQRPPYTLPAWMIQCCYRSHCVQFLRYVRWPFNFPVYKDKVPNSRDILIGLVSCDRAIYASFNKLQLSVLPLSAISSLLFFCNYIICITYSTHWHRILRNIFK